ncbi:MAG: glycoside hydrolase family 5 protein [Bacteroidota bacterium]|nr:glycoside hydrolase family 5 protein [Bacteroidota bacterium]
MKPTKLLLLFVSFILLYLQSFSQKDKTQKTSANKNWLRVSGDQIVNQKGDTVLLRGFGLGGMLHMENFINGYPANEEAMREGLKKVLGDKKYNLYFDAFYKSYFTEPDAAYIQSLGLNLVRIPINYRLFEDDMNPGVIKQGAFAYLDSVIARCARHQIYTIIDLHALPGAQNQHWHSDNPTHVASFWIHKDFQDRALHLWEVIANRYKNEPWVAGYDLINEPADPTGEKLFPYYKRLRNAIRKIDPKHILFLEGDRYAEEFQNFTEVWENTVYTNHDYAVPGFIDGGDYPGYSRNRYYDKDTLEKDFLKKSEFMFKHHVPVWVGEFGPVYTGNPQKDEMRYQVLKDQLAYYDKYKVSWCIWLYKDMGLQAIMHQKENTPYMKLVSKFLVRKDSLGADAWGSTDKNIRQAIAPLEELIKKEFPTYDPYPRGQQREIALLVRHILISEALLPEYCNLFKGLSEEQLIALAQSFRYDNCVKRNRLEDILTGREKPNPAKGLY